jgi:lauroyl/myristoyl acyltransferase
MKTLAIEDGYYLLVAALIRLAPALPAPLRRLLVNGVAEIALRFPRGKARRALTRMALAFPDEPARGHRRIRRQTLRTFWRDLLLLQPGRSDREDFRQARLEGLDRLRDGQAAGRGVILLDSNGFGSRIAARHLLRAQGYAVTYLHGPYHLGALLMHDGRATRIRQSLVKPFFDRCELQWAKEMLALPADDSLAFTRTLRARLAENGILCSAGDGAFGHRLIPAPFLGAAEPFPTGVFSLAQASGAALLPLFCWRDEDDSIRLVVESPLPAAPEAGVSQFARLLESYARRYPAQYYKWPHLAG